MKHLSPEQISRVVAGISIPEEMHVRECEECAAEVERDRNVLTLFRSSVRGWTDRLDHSDVSVRVSIAARADRSRSIQRAPMAWVVAAAVLAAVVALPIYQYSREQELKLQEQRDAQLMDDVNAQLSRSGPLAMDPLMRLMVSPDSGTAAASPGSRGMHSMTGRSGRYWETGRNDGASH